jgi:predicted transcriptional regulator
LPPAAARKFHAATRAGMKRLLIPVEPELHKKLKLLAVQQDTTLEALTRAALAGYIAATALDAHDRGAA